MLAYHHIASAAYPELRHHLRKANEERAAALYRAWKATTRSIAGFVRGLAEAISRARRARVTYRELSVLNDHQLKDIGLTRGEVASVAEAVATAAPDIDLTVAELRRSEHRDAEAREARVTAFTGKRNQPRRPDAGADAKTARPRAAAVTRTDKVAA